MSTDSLEAATGDVPFTYVGWCCQDDKTREAVRVATNAAFVALSPAQKHEVRMKRYGAVETRKIEARERAMEARARARMW